MTFRLVRTLLFIALIVHVGSFSRPASAAGIDFDPSFTQTQFRQFSEEAGLAGSYVMAAPAEPLGLLHFDIGVEISATAIHSNAAYWQLAFDGDAPSYLPVPKLRARAGLPLGIDVGAIYSYIPGLQASLLGGELKWAVYEGGVVMPAVAVRGSYSTLLGVRELDLQTYSADLSISKGFFIFTPYAGIGQVWIVSDINDPTLLVPITGEHQRNTRGFAGLEMGLPFMAIVVEAAFSTVNTYTARLSFGWQ